MNYESIQLSRAVARNLLEFARGDYITPYAEAAARRKAPGGVWQQTGPSASPKSGLLGYGDRSYGPGANRLADTAARAVLQKDSVGLARAANTAGRMAGPPQLAKKLPSMGDLRRTVARGFWDARKVRAGVGKF